jgi:hypothetical protein
MTTPTPQPSPHSAAPHPAPWPPPSAAFTGAPPYGRTPALTNAVRIVAGVQACVSCLFAVQAPPFALYWILGIDPTEPGGLQGRAALVAIYLVLGLAMLAAVAIGVSALCMGPGSRAPRRIVLCAEVVTSLGLVALACWQPTGAGPGLALGYCTVAATVVGMLLHPTVRRWSGA